MEGPLKNGKHEKFAQALAKGTAQGPAYAEAGYKRDDGAASRLSKNIKVQARVAELQSRAAEKVEFTIADMARQLDEDREFARECETPAAAVAASMGKAKVLGFLKDKLEIESRNLTSSTISTDPQEAARQYEQFIRGGK